MFRSVSYAVQKSCVLTTPVVRLSSFCLQSLLQEDLQRHTASQLVTILKLSYSAALRPHASDVACGTQVILFLYYKSFFKLRSFVSHRGLLFCRLSVSVSLSLFSRLCPRPRHPGWSPQRALQCAWLSWRTAQSAQRGWGCYWHVRQPQVAWASFRVKLLRKAQRECHC